MSTPTTSWVPPRQRGTENPVPKFYPPPPFQGTSSEGGQKLKFQSKIHPPPSQMGFAPVKPHGFPSLLREDRNLNSKAPPPHRLKTVPLNLSTVGGEGNFKHQIQATGRSPLRKWRDKPSSTKT
jgi:hypothetical protein